MTQITIKVVDCSSLEIVNTPMLLDSRVNQVYTLCKKEYLHCEIKLL